MQNHWDDAKLQLKQPNDVISLHAIDLKVMHAYLARAPTLEKLLPPKLVRKCGIHGTVCREPH